MLFKRTLAAAIGSLIVTGAFAATTDGRLAASADGSTGYAAPDNSYNKGVPLRNWSPVTPDFKQTDTAGKGRKAATDIVTVFRPVTPCRLIDTRAGQPSAQGNIGGTIVGGAGTRRTVDLTTSPCGIPNSSLVRALSLAFAVFNNTPNNGGFLAFTFPAAAPTGFNLIFSPGQQWLSTTAGVLTGGTGGDFDVFATSSTVDLIVDVNGYFQDMNDLDVGTQELDISGNGAGDTLGINNGGTGRALNTQSFPATGGTAIATGAFGTGGKAIDSLAGKFNVGGANSIGGTNFVYVHQVTAPSINGTCPSRSNLDHPMLNGNVNAVVLVTPLSDQAGSFVTPATLAAAELVNGANVCTGLNNWRLKFTTNAVVGDRYQIMIITNN